ncbi:MAG: tRNA(Ile)-lysidine synthetase [Flavipsychrobacter sp.]|jgi:tRNA(Ile)-lysidine synthase|nr:tRNA(Ile)-lysidine synthetase [Flavipsychrobacter sp.]
MILLEQFKEHWKAKNYLAHGERVLLAVSGGEDSMVMAHLFLKSGIAFGVAHCNFGLRGEAADGDEQHVKDWCAANNIGFHSVKFDTKQKSEEWKKGIQETARILRYEWFEIIRKQHSYVRIATAHHANDNVETLLINLFKGTGISGLHGILPENGKIIRPLLFATKEMIAAYTGANNITFREDASNASDDYLRNAVRHNVVPVVEQLFPNAVIHVNESIKRFAQAEVLYKHTIEQERKKLIEQRGQDHYIPVLKLQKRPALETLCYELFQPFGFGSAQVQQIVVLLNAESGHYIASGTHRIIKNRDFLIVTAMPSEQADFITVEAAPCTIETGKYIFSFSIHDKPKSIPASPDEAWLEMKEITFPLILRKWRMGDYLYPFGMGMKKKKVSRLLIDAKVPLHEKEDIRIVECNKRIAWIGGMRIDERFKIKDNTEKVLVVKRKAKIADARSH